MVSVLSSWVVLNCVPRGQFCAGPEYTPERITAIRYVAQRGQWLARNHPEIADLYRNLESPYRCIDIASMFLADTDRFPDVCAKAVVYALQLLLSPEERAALTHEHRRLQMIKRWDFTSEEWKKHCRKAAWRRHNLHRSGVNVEALLRGRGRVGWSREEKTTLWNLARTEDDKHRGQMTYGAIADYLNTHFHDNQPVRTANSCRYMVIDIRRRKTRRHAP